MLMGQKRLIEYNKVLSNVINTLSILVLPASVGLMMLSKDVVLIIAGNKYADSVKSLCIITWAIIFSIFSWIFTECVLIPAKREKKVLQNTIITAIINVILNFILIPSLSYDGTSLSTVIAEFVVMVLNGWACWDIIKPIILSKTVWKNLVSSITGCIGIVVICLLCDYGWNNLFFKLIFSIVLSVFIYGSILLLLKNQIVMDIFKQIKRVKEK